MESRIDSYQEAICDEINEQRPDSNEKERRQCIEREENP